MCNMKTERAVGGRKGTQHRVEREVERVIRTVYKDATMKPMYNIHQL